MCDCIEKIDQKLAPDHCLDATVNLMGGVRRAIIPLIRRDTWCREGRSKKRKSMLANFCPWCGEEYGQNEVTVAVEQAEATQ